MAVKLLEASLKYKVHLLTQRISQKLDSLLTCQNVPQFYRTAKKSNMKKVAEACVHFMCGNLDQVGEPYLIDFSCTRDLLLSFYFAIIYTCTCFLE